MASQVGAQFWRRRDAERTSAGKPSRAGCLGLRGFWGFWGFGFFGVFGFGVWGFGFLGLGVLGFGAGGLRTSGFGFWGLREFWELGSIQGSGGAGRRTKTWLPHGAEEKKKTAPLVDVDSGGKEKCPPTTCEVVPL